MPLASGARLGPYEIESAIGAGGMGEVYRAKDTRLDRTVAVKILWERLADRPDLRERFEREAGTPGQGTRSLGGRGSGGRHRDTGRISCVLAPRSCRSAFGPLYYRPTGERTF